MKAVRFDQYGGVDVLQVVDAPVPEPGQGEALIKVKAASINPGEAKIREGLLHARWPATFPSGEGSDFAGIVTKVGMGVASVKVGDQVIGFTDKRASHAEYVVAEARNLTPKPAGVPWEVAGSLAVASARRRGRGVRRGPGRSAAQVRFQRVHRLPRRRLRESGDRTGRAQGPHRHDHRFCRRTAIRRQRPRAARRRGTPGPWRSSPDWSLKASLTCRSPQRSHSPTSVQRSGSSSRDIRRGRSFSRRDRSRGWRAA
jgi:hypothetical protein